MRKTSKDDMLETYDYIVIGAGSAGCLLANRLSVNPDVRVLLLEAGGKDNYIWINIPFGYFYCLGNPRVDWGYETAPVPGLHDRTVKYTCGKVFGGGSSINAMIYMRGQAQDYDNWRQLGNTGWGWQDILPFFLKHEDQFALPSDQFGGVHAKGGEWRIESSRVGWDVLNAWASAADQAGIPTIDDFNRGNNEGNSYFHLNQKAGQRWNTVRGFIRPILDRPNLTVVTYATAQRLILQQKKVIGVEILRNEVPMRLGARREVILAAGAIGSPLLLQRSGIGPGDILSQNGIEPTVEQPHVGKNLQDHLEIPCVYMVSRAKTFNELSHSLWQRAQLAIDYALTRKGPMSMAPSQLGAFAKSDPLRQTADLQYHIKPMSQEEPGQTFHNFPAFTAGVCNVRPTSRGHVCIAAPQPDAAPEIQPNYLSTEEDCQTAVAAIRETRRIVSQSAMKPFSPQEYRPGKDISDDDDERLLDAARTMATPLFHAVGTCRMGSDKDAVVDQRLKVNGIDGLRIADASIMPAITSGNTNAPTLMIAEKGAEMILKDWEKG